MKLYHRTDRGEAIMREGFRDAGSRYGTTTWHEGVRLSDSSLAVNEGVNGDDLLVVEIVDAPALAEYEWVKEASLTVSGSSLQLSSIAVIVCCFHGGRAEFPITLPLLLARSRQSGR